MKNLSRRDRNGVRTAVDLERRYKFNDIDYTKEEIQKLKMEITTDDHLSNTSTNPIQNRVVTNALNTKVNKETGKGLSTNDYTNEEKSKVSSIPNNIETTENKVTSIDSTSTDKQYPSAKAVFDKMTAMGGVEVLDSLTSTSTTSALSANQGKVLRELIENEFYYKAGESITLPYATGGFLTTGSKEIQFSVPLPKRMDNVTPTIESGYIYIRKPEGGYLLNNVSIVLDNTITLTKTNNILRIQLIYNTAFEATNNIPLGIQVRDLKINFN